jgi:hypothetical protein
MEQEPLKKKNVVDWNEEKKLKKSFVKIIHMIKLSMC